MNAPDRIRPRGPLQTRDSELRKQESINERVPN